MLTLGNLGLGCRSLSCRNRLFTLGRSLFRNNSHLPKKNPFEKWEFYENIVSKKAKRTLGALGNRY